jgi:hydrogenase-4 component E
VIETLVYEGPMKVLLALVLITGAFIVTRRDFRSMVAVYALQSLMLGILALVMYAENHSPILLGLAVMTIVFKVIAIPYAIRGVQKQMKIKRDVEFEYLSPTGSMMATIALIMLVYYSFSGFVHELSLSTLFYLGSVFGVSLALMGMLITFTRRKVITKTIGYLTMENGVLLFGLFLTELPLIIEVLILIDLVILVLLATILALGMDASIEDFQARLHPFHGRKEDD